MLCGEWISTASNVLQAVAVIAAAVAAIKGLNTWRREIVGRRKVEIAEETLELVYELEAVITWARHPLAYVQEGLDREGRDEEPDEQKSLNDSYYSRITRLEQHTESFARLRILAAKCRAYFGEELQQSLLTFWVVRTEINQAVGMLINAGEDYPQNLRNKHEETIWDMSDDDNLDNLASRVAAAVVNADETLKPLLQES